MNIFKSQQQLKQHDSLLVLLTYECVVLSFFKNDLLLMEELGVMATFHKPSIQNFLEELHRKIQINFFVTAVPSIKLTKYFVAKLRVIHSGLTRAKICQRVYWCFGRMCHYNVVKILLFMK